VRATPGVASESVSGSATRWADAAGRRLAEAGYRRGGARRAVVELLAGQRCALSALEIEELLRDSGRQAGRASIYRVLEELEELGLVARLDLGTGTARYEAVDPAGDRHHHHLLCDECGDLVPFSDAELERVIGRVSRRLPHHVRGHDVTLHGSCSSCSAG
jgi:Fur family transcriptional regulator, ferric uptake regulator